MFILTSEWQKLHFVTCSWEQIQYIPESTNRAFLPFDIVTYFSLNLWSQLFRLKPSNCSLWRSGSWQEIFRKFMLFFWVPLTKEKETEFVYQWLLYKDVNLFFPLEISFFNSGVKAAFWKEICILPFIKKKRRKNNLVAFPFCLWLSGSICTHSAPLHPESGRAAQDCSACFPSPSSWDVPRVEFFSSGSRRPGCSMPRHPVLSADLSKHVRFHGWMQQLLQRQTHVENKQPTPRHHYLA